VCFILGLGHGAPVFYHAALPGHILAGIQYALGDLHAALPGHILAGIQYALGDLDARL
jgi:hypothetical protein